MMTSVRLYIAIEKDSPKFLLFLRFSSKIEHFCFVFRGTYFRISALYLAPDIKEVFEAARFCYLEKQRDNNIKEVACY